MTRSGSADLSIELAPSHRVHPSILRAPAVAILAISAIVAVPLMLLSIVDVGGLRLLWDNLHWSETSVAAGLATAVSVRGSVGRARTVRIAGAVAFGLWMIVNLLWAWLNLMGRATVPSVADIFIFAVLIPGLFVIPATIRGRLTWAEEAAVYLDSALLFCLLGTVLVLLDGSQALALPTMSGVIAIAYPTTFIGLGAAGVVALVAARYPLAPRGAFALIAGVTMVGLAYLGWVAPTVQGTSAGVLPSILFTVGTLVAAYGVATWQDEESHDPRYLAVTRSLARAIGPAAAGITFLALLPQVSQDIEAVVDVGVFVAGGLFVTRQALLLRERTTMLDEVTRLKFENDRLVRELRLELEEHALDQRRMIQASRAAAVGELAAGVAHEVNNPLAVVLGFAELLQDELDEGDPRRASVETIRSHALRARAIVRALGEFAQRGEPTLVPTDLGDLVRRTVDLVRFPLASRGVTIDERYAPLSEVLIDPQAIQQALINVLANATQAVADAGRIEIATGGTDLEVAITVTDDGVGMTETTASRAFEPFFTGREFESDDAIRTGLGLAVSRGLIEAHGGTITLTSGPGRGTRVELRLPVHRPATDDGHGTPEGGNA